MRGHKQIADVSTARKFLEHKVGTNQQYSGILFIFPNWTKGNYTDACAQSYSYTKYVLGIVAKHERQPHQTYYSSQLR